MSRAVDNTVLVIGGVPRVDLLPPEVKARRKAKAIHRLLGYGVAAVALVVVAAIGGVSALGLQAQAQLSSAQLQTGVILAQQKKYLEVRQVQREVSLVQAAQQVGASTEISWKDYLMKVQSTLPANVVIKTVTIDSATPLAIYAQPTAPLQGARVATLTFEATSPTLPEVQVWLTALATLPGFADATPGSVSLDPTNNVYTAKITMHINEAAFDGRFAAKGK